MIYCRVSASDCGHFFDKIDRIVEEEFFHNGFKFAVVHRTDKNFFAVRAHLDESFGGEFFGKYAKNKRDVLFGHLVENGGEVGRVEFFEKRL